MFYRALVLFATELKTPGYVLSLLIAGNIRDRSKKSRSGEYKNYLIIKVIKSVDDVCARASPEASTCEVRNQV